MIVKKNSKYTKIEEIIKFIPSTVKINLIETSSTNIELFPVVVEGKVKEVSIESHYTPANAFCHLYVLERGRNWMLVEIRRRYWTDYGYVGGIAVFFLSKDNEGRFSIHRCPPRVECYNDFFNYAYEFELHKPHQRQGDLIIRPLTRKLRKVHVYHGNVYFIGRHKVKVLGNIWSYDNESDYLMVEGIITCTHPEHKMVEVEGLFRVYLGRRYVPGDGHVRVCHL